MGISIGRIRVANSHNMFVIFNTPKRLWVTIYNLEAILKHKYFEGGLVVVNQKYHFNGRHHDIKGAPKQKNRKVNRKRAMHSKCWSDLSQNDNFC